MKQKKSFLDNISLTLKKGVIAVFLFTTRLSTACWQTNQILWYKVNACRNRVGKQHMNRDNSFS